MLKCHVIMANKHFGMLAFSYRSRFLVGFFVVVVVVIYGCVMRNKLYARLMYCANCMYAVRVEQKQRSQVEKWREMKPNSIKNPIHLNLLIFIVVAGVVVGCAVCVGGGCSSCSGSNGSRHESTNFVYTSGNGQMNKRVLI